MSYSFRLDILEEVRVYAIGVGAAACVCSWYSVYYPRLHGYLYTESVSPSGPTVVHATLETVASRGWSLEYKYLGGSVTESAYKPGTYWYIVTWRGVDRRIGRVCTPFFVLVVYAG